MKKFNFNKIWERVKSETDLKKLRNLSEFVGASSSNISNKRKVDNFPLEWAYKISDEYNLSIKWIMEGIGTSRPDQPSRETEIISQIEKWISETEKKQPGALSWFKFDFRKKYPEFDKWEKREEDSLPGNISTG